jgi:ATP:ADP antiporter, AAA family
MQTGNDNAALGMTCAERYPILKSPGLRSVLMFTTFMLIIMSIYHLKPASRSLFIEYVGADSLPYAWIATAVTMILGLGYYHRLVARKSRLSVVLGTCAIAIALLAGIRLSLIHPDAKTVVGFMIFVDIFSVVLVEQFWSLANSIFTTGEGKKWYGIVGSGGLAGGIAGGSLSAFLVKYTALETIDLLTVCLGILSLIFLMTWVMNRLGIFCQVDRPGKVAQSGGGWKLISRNRYLMLIAALLLLGQWISPLIDFQFLKTVEANYTDLEARTAFLAFISAIIGFVSIGVNLLITPFVHSYLGAIVGLMVQPLLIFMSSFGFLVQSSAVMASATKVSDKSLSYSINRASRELLYIPLEPVLIYQAKAWIDMFGYRIFKVLGSLVIIGFTQWSAFSDGIYHLSWVTLFLCMLWIAGIFVLRRDYRAIGVLVN